MSHFKPDEEEQEAMPTEIQQGPSVQVSLEGHSSCIESGSQQLNEDS